MHPFAGLSFEAIRRVSVISLLLAGCLAAVASGAAPQANGRVPQPVIESARGDKCVEEPAFMRRHHMELLKHQRDETMHRGIRGGKYSLKACIACHASHATGSVAAASTNFCQSCHTYAAVKIDCFECHSTKPVPALAHPPSPQAKPGQPAATPLLQGMALQQQVKP
jgi:hypothetical protein